MKDIKAVLKIFQTGAITITAPCVLNVQIAVERIYPLVHEYRKAKPPDTKNVSRINSTKQLKKDKINTPSLINDDLIEESDIDIMDEDIGSFDDDDYSDKSD